MQKIYSVLLFALFANIFTVNAQSVIRGKVIDNRGNAIEGVSIVLFEDSLLSPPMLGYTISKKDGSFIINTTIKGPCWMSLKSIGYSAVAQCVNIPTDSMEVVMHEDNRTLGEILIKGKYLGVKVDGDTIKFDTDHFKIGTESTIGEVLDRLPGIDVSTDGDIYYGGKAIGRMLIDGKDIFSQNSNKLIVNNMSADIMKGAEIIKNYNDDTLADKYRQGNTTAINILTDGKQKLTGAIDLLGGYEEKHNAKIGGLSLGNKFNATFVVSSNNLGKPVFSIKDYLSYIVGTENLINGHTSNKLNISGAESMLLYVPDNISGGEGKVVAFNTSYKPNNGFRIKGNIIYSSNQLKETTNSNDTYFASEQVVNNKSDNERSNIFWGLNIDATWKPNRHTEFFSKTTLRLVDSEFDHDILNSNRFTIQQNKNWQKNNIAQVFSLRHEIGASLLYANANFSCGGEDNAFHLYTNKMILPIKYYCNTNDSSILTYQNDKKNKSLFFSPEIGYSLNITANYNLNTFFSYIYDKRIATYLKPINDVYEETFRLDEYKVGTSLRKRNGFFRYKLGLSYVFDNYKSNIGFKKRDCNFLSPQLDLELVFSQTRNLSLSFSRSSELFGIEQLSRAIFVDDYKSLIMPSMIDVPYQINNDLTLNYHDYNIPKQFYLTLIANVKHANDAVIPYITQDGILSGTSFGNNGSQTNVYGILNVEKHLSFIPINITTRGSYTYTENRSKINGIKNDVKLHSVNIRFNALSRFKGLLNGELTAEWGKSKNLMTAFDKSNRMSKIMLQAKVVSSFNQCKTYVSFRYDYADNYTYSAENYDIGFGLEYSINKLKLKITGENILNISGCDFTNIISTSYYQSIYSYEKMPGNIMAGVSWIFD